MEAVGLKARSTAAMRSPINWALLGLVMQRPSYGYELVLRFERTYMDMVELSSRSQIYTALDSLVRRGLVEETRGEATKEGARQPKPHYKATKAGLATYDQWLVEQVGHDQRRSRLIAQHVAALEPEHALRLLERCASQCLDAAGKLPAEDGGQQDGATRPAAVAKRLAGEDERLRAGAVLSWIEYARSELRAAAKRTGR